MDTLKEKLTEFFSKQKNLYLTFAIGGGLVALGLILLVAVLLAPKPADNNEPVSAEEKEEILTEIIRNNPEGIINFAGSEAISAGSDSVAEDNDQLGIGGPNAQNSDVIRIIEDTSSPISKSNIPAADHYSNGEVTPVDGSDLAIPDLGKYNYRITNSSITPGFSAGICERYDSEARESTYHEYFEPYHAYYYNSEEVNGELDRLSIGLYGNDINEYYTYEGGEFAARLLYTVDPDFELSSNPLSYTNDTPSDSYPTSYNLRHYFGRNVELLEILDIDGERFFLIESTFDEDCNLDYSDDTTIVSRILVNNETYSVVERSLYISSVEAENLVFTERIDTQRTKVQFDEVASVFSFGDAEIIDVNYINFLEEQDRADFQSQTKSNLLEHEMTYIYPVSANYKFISVASPGLYEKVENDYYYYERAYYPQTVFGQEKFDKITERRAKIWILRTQSISRPGHFTRVNVDYYTKDFHTIETLQEEIDRYEILNREHVKYLSEDTFLTAGTREIPAKKIGYEYFYSKSVESPYPDSITDSYPDSFGLPRYRYVTVVYLVEFETHIVKITNSNVEDTLVENLILKSEDPEDSNYESFTEMLANYHVYGIED